jgi:predicted ATPase
MSIPEKIGRYKIERRVGRGGMAVIYLAHDPVMKRPVAIKLLPRELTLDPLFKARFEREVETLATLEHPAIVPVYDFGEHHEQLYYVMRFMPGGSLVDRLRRGALSVPEAARILRQIAPALDAAHRKSIIHRDIKPGNILFDADDHAYLSDFGIVKLAGSTAEFTGSAVLGTPSYMSPELARGDPDIDGRSDVYALGVLLFRMWAGVVPFTANTPMGIAMKHVTEPVPNITHFKPDLPADCDLLIQTAMAKNRDERFATASQLTQALDRIAQGQSWLPDETPTHTTPADDLPAASRPRGSRAPAGEVQPPSNLPAQPTLFIGREAELARVGERLADPDSRLITLLGPGGIGKTRLAVEAASRAPARFPQGVYFIPLAPLTSAEMIVPAIAQGAGFSFYAQGDPKEQLLNYLRTKQLLLVLDNFEHLIGEAGLVAEILAAAPQVKILATARERLNLQEEWIVQVHGMEMPADSSPEAIESFPAIALFLDRAAQVSPGFALSEADKPYVVRICQLLEGIPLGIELAAAWVRMLSPQEIASEIEQNLDFLTSSLRNVTQRHRSLRAVFNYSWDLLASAEQDVFRKLAVFRGGFTRGAAKDVAEASLAHLGALVDKSLLRRLDGGRYEMLEILRQYAEEKLVEDKPLLAKMQGNHAACFTGLLDKVHETITGSGQKEALESIAAEIENIRGAWAYALERLDSAVIERAFDPLYRFYEIRGWLKEGADSFDRLCQRLDAASRGGNAPNGLRLLQLRAQSRQAAFLYRLGQPAQAHILLTDITRELRLLNAPPDLAFALTYLGAVEYLRRELGTARRHLQESLAMLRNSGSQLGTAIALHHLALVARESGDFPEARRLFEESLLVNRGIGSRFGEAISLNNLGTIAFELGEYSEAWELHRQSLELREEIDDRWGIANSLHGLGLVAYNRGEYPRAQQLFADSLEIYREIGDVRRMERAAANRALVEDALAAGAD